jgi:hypothetical protein
MDAARAAPAASLTAARCAGRGRREKRGGRKAGEYRSGMGKRASADGRLVAA